MEFNWYQYYKGWSRVNITGTYIAPYIYAKLYLYIIHQEIWNYIGISTQYYREWEQSNGQKEIRIYLATQYYTGWRRVSIRRRYGCILVLVLGVTQDGAE